MNEIIGSLEAVGLAALALVLGLLAQFLRRKAAQIFGDEIWKSVSTAVSTAVATVNQRQVDGEKKSGNFDLEAQRKALEAALDLALDLLPPNIKNALEKEYASAAAHLEPLIEAEVRAQKKDSKEA